MKVVFLCKDSHKTMETVCNIIPPQSTADYHLIGLFAHESGPPIGPPIGSANPWSYPNVGFQTNKKWFQNYQHYR